MAGGPRIQVLPGEVADRIAAGEVVERPASVVKELAENSLDAGARRIAVEVQAGGRRSIRVADDGHGMSAEEARLALRRHATSKIREAGDLEAVRSLGFRGEALPSIAAVSRVELVTRERESTFGCRLRVEAGRVLAAESAGAPPGTVVSVENLFFNTPARRKQLRRPGSELARVVETLQGLALARPGVAIRLEHQGRLLLQSAGDGDARQAAAAVLGGEVARRLLFAEAHPDDADPPYGSLRALIARPEAARATRDLQFFIVNQRVVRSGALRDALERPYRGLLPLHRYPVAVTWLEVPPAYVDVNVHPSKQTVRFVRTDEVAAAVRTLVGRTLAAADLAPSVRLSGRGTPAAEPEQLAVPPEEAARSAPREQERAGRDGGGRVFEDAPSYGRERPAFAALRVLGQIEQTYLVAEGARGLYLIDQHAAHERAVFEQLLGAADRAPPPRQVLSVPRPVELDAAGMDAWRRWGERVAAHGFVAEDFGPRTVLLRQVPVLYRGEAGAQAFRDLLAALDATGGGEGDLASDLAQRTMAACKAAVKAHDALAPAEIDTLLAALDACANPYTCPHGRPTLLVVTLRELERHFKRTG